MDGKKRTMYVVMFLFLVVFLGVVALNGEEGDTAGTSGSAEDPAPEATEENPLGKLNDHKYWAWYIGCTECDNNEYDTDVTLTCGEDVLESEQGNTQCIFLPRPSDSLDIIPLPEVGDDSGCGYPLGGDGVTNDGEDMGIPYFFQQSGFVDVPSDGCYALAIEDELGASDHCGYKIVKPGFNFNKDAEQRIECFKGDNSQDSDCGLGWDSGADTLSKAKSDSRELGPEYMLNLYDTGDVFRRDVKTNILWKSGYNTDFICADMTHYWHQCTDSEDDLGSIVYADDKVYRCEQVGDRLKWTDIGEDKDGDRFATVETDDVPADCDDSPADNPEFCEDLEGNSPDAACGDDVKYAKCAACIHPNAPEVCGDGVNEESNAGGNDCNVQTSDNCNNFKEGCEQIPSTPAEGEEEGEPHRNIKDESFSWISTTDGGYCCGFNGIETDLGLTKTGSPDTGGDEQDFLCLNKNTELVGYAGASSDGTSTLLGWGATANCAGESNWCWVSALSSQFNIFTIKKPLDEPYDMVSNSVEWKQCSDTEGTHDFTSGVNLAEFSKASRFYCYDEGNHWSWAECLDDLNYAATESTGNGAKRRKAGDGLFLIPITNTGDNYAESDLKTEFAGFYDEEGISTKDYDALEFTVRFTTEPLVLPVQLEVTLIGASNTEYLKQNVLGATDNAVLQSGKPLHVRMPIPHLEGLEKVQILSTVQNHIIVENIFFSSSTLREKEPFCSGDERLPSVDGGGISATGAWLPEIDYYDASSLLSGQALCNQRYGVKNADGISFVKEAWLGNELSQRNCCGDDSNEYYNGADSENACWNSQVLSAGETAMNVEVDVQEYQKEEYTFFFPEINIDLSLLSDLRSDSILIPGLRNILLYSQEDNKAFFYNEECGGADNPVCTSPELPPLDLNRKKIVVGEFLTDDFKEGIQSVEISPEGKLIVKRMSDLLSYEVNFKLVTEISNSDFSSTQQYIPSFNSGVVTFSWQDEEGNILGTYNKIVLGELENVDKVILVAERTSETEIIQLEGFEITDYAPVYAVYDAVKYPLFIGKKVTSVNPETSFTFPCSSTECVFPLPGKPPYKLTNHHPELYDLYFKYADGEVLIPGTDATLLDTSLFVDATSNPVYGNLIARRVPQQVLYVKGALDTEGQLLEDTQGFYSCNAASYVENKILEIDVDADGTAGDYGENLIQEKLVCDVFNLGFSTSVDTGSTAEAYITGTRGFFCAPSSPQLDAEGNYINMKVSEWSTDNLLQNELGYTVVTSLSADVDPLPEELQLTLNMGEDEAFKPHQRDQVAEAIPARNLLSNADFASTVAGNANDLSGWEVFQIVAGREVPVLTLSDGNEKTFADETTSMFINGVESEVKIFNLEAEHILRSEPFAVPQNKKLQLKTGEGTEGAECGGVIRLFDKEGTEEESPASVRTTSAASSFAIVEFQITSGSACPIQQPSLQIIDGEKPSVPYDYKSDVPKPRSALACCPDTYCWNGYACIAPFDEINYPDEYTYMVDYVQGEEGDERNYRCFDGQWKDMPPKKDWNYQRQGFCEETTQCFVLSSREADVTVTGSNLAAQEELTEGETEKTLFHAQQIDNNFKLPACINAGDYILDHYCEVGTTEELADDDSNNDAKWTSRTKFLAADLLKVGEDSGEYSLYCTTPELALLEISDEVRRQVLGDEAVTVSGGLTGGSTATTACFKTEHTDLIPNEDNTCINNVCVLKIKDDEDGKVLFGTTVNKPFADSDSFIDLIEERENLKENCADQASANPEVYQECLDEDKKHLFVKGDKQIVAFSKEISSLNPSVLDRLLEFFKNLLGLEGEPDAAESFIAKADNYRDVFLLNINGKQVHALIERLPGEKKGESVIFPQTLLMAEYAGFQTPVCAYVNKQRLVDARGETIAAFEGTIFPETYGESVLKCTEGDLQRVEVLVSNHPDELRALFQLWPQLTGKLRVEG